MIDIIYPKDYSPDNRILYKLFSTNNKSKKVDIILILNIDFLLIIFSISIKEEFMFVSSQNNNLFFYYRILSVHVYLHLYYTFLIFF